MNQEDARVAAVQALGILDTEPESAFDDAVKLAAAICGTPISLISLLDGRRQWFKARLGLSASETPQEQAFCAHAIQGQDLFVVADAQQDPRFQDNPLVTGEPNIRFYAGMPLITPEGHALGTLCVIDTAPRQLTEQQKTALGVLSRQVYSQMRLRNQLKGLNQTLAERSIYRDEVSGANTLFRAFMDNGPMVAFVKDAEGRFVYYNSVFAKRFNITRDEWIGKGDFEVWPREFAADFRELDLKVLQDGKLVVIEETSPGPDGSVLHWRSYKFPFIGASGEQLLAGIALDLSVEKRTEAELRRSHEELHKANQRLRELAVTDALTGISNRRGFDERLQREFRIATRYGSDFSVLLVDIDHFKEFNDSFGHEAGDEALQRVAEQLIDCSRVSDLVCRHGGEEFALLLPRTTLDDAVALGERICASVAGATWKRRRVTVSIGAAAIATNPPNSAALIRQADLALYEAKSLGRNQVVAFSPALAPAEELVV
jgi:diguanylate cyclase (GGDEF)-like protein/PAS domain S-box-containing protein